ncbi:hypothetical protein ACFFHT_02775, partial [Gallibacterium melopsittaci]
MDANNGATINATNSATVNDGDVTVQNGGALNVGTTEVPKNLALNGGNLTVAGTVNAENITSNQASDPDTNAVINVSSNGALNLVPAGNDTLFEGFDTSKGDKIGIGGKLNLDIADGQTVTQESTADITANKDGNKGTLNKDGKGTLNLAANNTVGTTNVKDGKVSVAADKTLNSNTVNVGDGTGDAGSAALDILGTLDNVTNLNVKADGSVNVGDTDNAGTVNTDNLTVDGGTVEVNKGTVEADVTNINEGAVAIASGAKLDSEALNVGDGRGNASSAILTNAGTVQTDNVTVKADGNLTNSSILIATGNLTVDGGQLNSSGTTSANNLTVDNNGTVNVTAGTTTVTADTNINNGTANVENGAKLQSANINVGD